MTLVIDHTTPIITRPEAAKYLRLSERTIDELRANKSLAYHKVGGKVRFSKNDLDEFLARSRVAARIENKKELATR